jgi:hypothetical protein
VAKLKRFGLDLRQLRRSLGVKQKHVKGFKQASVSKIESRDDILLSTLADYIHALGLELEVRAIGRDPETGEETVRVLIRSENRNGKDKEKKRDLNPENISHLEAHHG